MAINDKIIFEQETDKGTVECSRNIHSLEELVISRYANGMSLSDIRDELKHMGYSNFSEPVIADILNVQQKKAADWLKRPLESFYWVVWLDALVFKVSDNGRITERIICLCVGLRDDGQLEMLGLWTSLTENVDFCEEIFQCLKKRGVEDILLFFSDQISGLPECLKCYFPSSCRPIYVLNLLRNSCHFVVSGDREAYRMDMQNIFEARNNTEAMEKLNLLYIHWRNIYPYAMRLWNDNLEDLNLFFKIPFNLRKQICKLDYVVPLGERIRRYIKSRLSFPSDEIVKSIVYYYFLEIRGKSDSLFSEWEKTRINLWNYYKK